MNPAALFDTVTKAVAAAGAAAAIYTFIAKRGEDVVSVVLTVLGLGYLGFFGYIGLYVVAAELLFWRGPVHRRPSHFYRVMLTRPAGQRIPTNWEIAGQARRRDQVLTLLIGVGEAVSLGAISYLIISEELSDGFPIESWSMTWVAGSAALGGLILLLGHKLWLWWKEGRRHRTQRCAFCGQLSLKEARVCVHCQEWFPAWKLLGPSPQPPAELPRPDRGKR